MIRYFYRITIMGMFNQDFNHWPDEKETLECVSRYFPTFHVNGDMVTWTLEKIYYYDRDMEGDELV